MSRRALVLLLAFLFVMRAALVLANADVFFYGDELAKGTAAKGLLEGVGEPRWKLAYVYHEGGGFLVTHLKVIAFALVGESVLAHKLVAILTTSLLLWVGCSLASESFGRNAGLIFGVLFVLCPTSFLRYSLLSLGTHFEAVLFAALALRCAMRLSLDERPSLRDWAGLGFSGGLGLYFSLQTIPAIAAAGLWILVRKRGRVPAAGIGAAAAGFALGGVPLWWMMSHVGMRALFVQEHTNFGAGLRGWSAVREWFHSLDREPDLGSWVRALGYPVVILAGMFAGASPETARLRQRAAPILFYLALFVLLYAGSGFAIGNDQVGHLFWLRSSALWFFGTMLFSAGAAVLLERGPRAWRGVAASVLVLVLVTGIAALASLLRAGRPAEFAENWELLTKTKGYDLTDYFDKYVDHFEDSPAVRMDRLEAFRDDPELLLPSAAHSVFEHAGRPLDEALAFVRERFGDRWTIAALGLGLQVAPDYGRDLARAFKRIGRQADDAQPALAEALGRVALGLKIVPEKIDAASTADAPPGLRPAFLRGVGWRIHRLYRLRPDLASALIERQPVEARASLAEGWERAREANELR